MKFKVGDKVRVRDDLVAYKTYGNSNNWLFFNVDMEKFRGKSFVVRSVVGKVYFLEGTGCWAFNDEMLEPVIEPKVVENPMEKLVIYRDGDRFVAKYYKGDKTVNVETESVCGFGTVSDYLLTEILDKMKQEEIGYTWVKCVGYRTKDRVNFTIDKKYKIYNNGRITSDTGFVFGGKKTKKDMLDFLSRWYIFEEVDKSDNPS